MRCRILKKKTLVLMSALLLLTLLLMPICTNAETVYAMGAAPVKFTDTMLGKILVTLLVAMLPVIELRGAIPIGVGMDLEYYVAVIVALIGNILPVPFIIFFFRRIFEWLAKKVKFFDRVWTALRDRTIKKSDVVQKYGFWGLCILVAIPLPGTGAWTGAMVACLLEMPFKKSAPSIILGVVIAAVIVTAVTYLGFDVIF